MAVRGYACDACAADFDSACRQPRGSAMSVVALTRMIVVHENVSELLKGAKAEAMARFRELVSELSALTSAFPDLSDAFDADELPVPFILRRDSPRGKGRRITPGRLVVTPNKAADRRRLTKARTGGKSG
jgi:hypothetical protein